MIKKQLLLATIFLLIMPSFANVAVANITCTPIPAIWVYDCETSSKGPLAIEWIWTIGGNNGGQWASPPFNPRREWYCDNAGTANTQVHLVVGWNDDSFTNENQQIDCLTISQGPPTNIQVAWSFGWCHQCDCTEWETSHSATFASNFTVLDSASQSGPWNVYSTTSAGISYPHNGTNGRWYKVKASNAAGDTYSTPVWKTGSNCSNCGGGGEDP